ncbi:MAG: DoxX family protein [Rubrobacteraceae bacterium]
MENRDPGEQEQNVRDGIYTASRIEGIVMVAAIAIASIGLGYLFFTQLWWKVPPDYRCNKNEQGEFLFARADSDGELVRERGLCNWIGIEEFYSDQPRKLFTAGILRQFDGPELFVPIGPAQAANGWFIENVVKPNISWFGYIIWASEAFIALSLILGFLSRLGGLVAIGMSMQLMIGLAGIPDPFEWEWSYQLMVLLSIIVFGLAPGRYYGLDRLIRPRLKALRDRGSSIARILLLFT